MNNETKNHKCKKTSKNLLTDLSAAVNLKIAPESPQANRRVSKELTGGKVDTTQPPRDSGFFLCPLIYPAMIPVCREGMEQKSVYA